MDDSKIYAKGGDDGDVAKYAQMNGADISMEQERIGGITGPLAEKLYAECENILRRYCGERGDLEGVRETLERIIRERDILLRNAIKRDLLKLK